MKRPSSLHLDTKVIDFVVHCFGSEELGLYMYILDCALVALLVL